MCTITLNYYTSSRDHANSSFIIILDFLKNCVLVVGISFIEKSTEIN